MAIQHGFELIQEQDISELNTHARFFRHIKTGAELLSLENDDENKCFNITFRTPPADSTGVSHILEHAALAGSRKYPVKEPFIELIKGSLKTFVNAFTSSDWTTYPLASQNLQDFYNLIDVYLDAVFYPLLSEHTFHQEGWHYELDDIEEPLSYKGVVFNEMKGNYASAEDVLSRNSQWSLFPGHVYGLDAGGDPRHIPELTHEQFKDFHDRYYHPSNARILFYGDDPVEERLRLLNRWLSDFDPLDIDSTIPLYPPFEQPRRIEKPFIAGEDAKPYVTVNWALAESTDPEINFGLSILGHILVGTPASPLRKALVDSGLGEDVVGVGLDSDIRQMYFSTGLKGIEIGDIDTVETLIFDTLQRLADDGIDERTIQASMNTIEFTLRENNTGGFPRGLAVGLRALGSWIYDADPLALLAFETPLDTIKSHLNKGERYFEGLIQRYFLHNCHRTTLILTPDTELQAQWEADEAARLAQIKAGMSQDDLQSIMAEAQELLRIQQTPDAPEALAAIPRLTLEDLDRENKQIPIDISEYNGSKTLFHDIFTNGITYLDVGMNLQIVPAELLPYVSLFARALLDMGTESEDFVSLSQRIGSKTGGIGSSTLTASDRAGKPVTWLMLRGKAMVEQTEDLLSILHDVLLTTEFDDKERFRQIVLEEKASQEASLLPAGHAVINGRLRSHFDEAGWVSEQMGGISYLFFLRELLDEMESNWSNVLERLLAVRSLLVNREAMLWNATLDADHWPGVNSQIQMLVDKLPAPPVTTADWSQREIICNEGLTIPAQVNYVGKGENLYDLGYELHGSIHVIANFVRTTWLWERIRMQGGAYGAFCVFDQRSGVFNYLSYRDPNLLDTLDNYDGAANFLRTTDLNEDELIKSIIGVIGTIDAYMLPDAKGNASMQRYLIGETDALRQQLRDEVLGSTAADFQAFADVLTRLNSSGHVVVLGSEGAIVEANAERDEPLAITKVL